MPLASVPNGYRTLLFYSKTAGPIAPAPAAPTALDYAISADPPPPLVTFLTGDIQPPAEAPTEG